MERYGVIYGTDSLGEYGQMAISDNIRDLVERTNTPYPMEAVELAQKLMSGYEQLGDWDGQPKKNKPLAIRYGCVRLANRFDMPAEMKPLYAVSVSGVEILLGYKKYNYAGMALVDRRELLSQTGMNYMDHIFGTHLLGAGEMERVRQGMGKCDPALKPERVTPVLKEEDLPAAVTIANLVLSGKRVIVRLEKGYVFNQRALELLAQVYSLLPPQRAIETGFAAYVPTGKIKTAIDEVGISIFVVPGDVTVSDGVAGCTLVDLEQDAKFPGGNMAVCLRRWAQLGWEDRYEAMLKVFGGLNGAAPSGDEYVAKSIKFFSDPIFKFKPAPGKCPTLEALKAEFDRYPALAMDIGSLNETFRRAIPVLMGTEAVFFQQKAGAAALARTARDPEERKKQTALYRFAQKLEPGDASLHAIVQTEKLVEEKLQAETREKIEAAERVAAEQAEKMAAELRAKAREEQEQALSRQAADHDRQLQQRLQAQKAAMEKEMEAVRKTLTDEAEEDRQNLNAIITQLGEENQRTEENLRTVSDQVRKEREEHEKEKRRLKSDHASEIEKLRRAHEAEEQKRKEANLAEMNRLKAAHAAELKQAQEAAQTAAASVSAADAQKLKQTYEAELERLKTAHAAELKQAQEAARTAAAPGASADVQKLKQTHEAEMKRLREANLAELNRLKTAHAAEVDKLKREKEQELRAQHDRLMASRPQTGAVQSQSAQAVSDRAKQIIAAQLLRNLQEVEQLKLRHQAELSAAKKGVGA